MMLYISIAFGWYGIFSSSIQDWNQWSAFKAMIWYFITICRINLSIGSERSFDGLTIVSLLHVKNNETISKTNANENEEVYLPKLWEVEINNLDVVAVLLIHLIHQVFDQVGPLESVEVLEDHVQVEHRRFKHVKQWTILPLVENDLTNHYFFVPRWFLKVRFLDVETVVH